MDRQAHSHQSGNIIFVKFYFYLTKADNVDHEDSTKLSERERQLLYRRLFFLMQTPHKSIVMEKKVGGRKWEMICDVRFSVAGGVYVCYSRRIGEIVFLFCLSKEPKQRD